MTLVTWVEYFKVYKVLGLAALHHHFGTVNLCRQRIGKFMAKTNVQTIHIKAQGSNKDLIGLLVLIFSAYNI